MGVLELKDPISPSTFEYVKFIYNWARTASFAPPIAFGEDDGGGQRSGVTLELRMWPLLKATRRSRSYIYSAVERGMDITARILKQKQYSRLPGKIDVTAGAIDSLLERRLTANLAPLLPRDQNAIVDRVVKMLSTNPPTISIQSALEELGYGLNELSLIISMLEDARFSSFFEQEAKEIERPSEMKDDEEKENINDGETS